jgi:hypothetical protein
MRYASESTINVRAMRRDPAMTDAPKDEATPETPASADTAQVTDDVYSQQELTDLTRALGQVVLGAGMSEKSGSFGLMREIVAAMQASAVFVGESSNPLLKQIVTQADPSDMDEAEKDKDESPESAQKAVEEGIAAAQRTHDLLLAKGRDDDADAWAQLLLTAANAAVQATKTGGFLGIGGEKVTASEQAYMQRLADTLGYKKES